MDTKVTAKTDPALAPIASLLDPRRDQDALPRTIVAFISKTA